MRKLILGGRCGRRLYGSRPVRMAQSPIIIKFSHVVANDTPKGKGALKFKELAEKYTDGKVKVEVYPNSQLYKDKEEIEALQLGSVQMLAPSTAKFAPLGAKEFEALDLPWLFKDEATYAKAMKGPVGKWLFKKLEAKGITGLAYWDNGFHMVSANRPLLMPADFQGLKIRISGSKIADQYFRDVGSIPQIMAFSEVYQALQTGVVDGCENTRVELSDAEIPRGAEAHHRLLSRASAIRGDRELQVLERPAGRHPRRSSTRRWTRRPTTPTRSRVKENEDALAEIKESGKTTLHYLTDDQRKAWQTAMQPTYKWAKGRVGSEVLDLLAKELDIKMN